MGEFVWHDLMTTDADRARGFYGELFGWRFEAIAVGPFRGSLVMGDGERIGAILPEPSLPASHWMPYVGVGDVEAACARIESLGGHVCTPAIEVAPLGRFAIAGDPQGGWFSLVERDAAAAPARHRFGWDELATDDVLGAATFYAVLFGWAVAPSPDGDAREVRRDARAIGAIRAGEPDAARPAWIPSILVDDALSATARALRLGAKVIAPGVLADPSGARFSLRGR